VFSFTKLLVLVAVIAFVWFGWRWFQRWELERRMGEGGRVRDKETRRLPAEDMAACRICGVYVAQGAKSCGRAECPYPR